MPTYAIGDLQGCYPKLLELLDRIPAAAEPPRLIFVGDLVNRGPNSLVTLRTVRAMGEHAQVVLGNHDLHLLAVAYGIRRPSASDTLDEILAAPDREELLEWLRHQPLALSAQGYLLVHAGVLPQWTAQQTLELAREVESVLRGPGWLDFLRQMYGNLPDKWDDNLQGVDRLRCIVNALTRVRYCAPDGRMLLSDGPLTGYLPWFELPSRKTADTPIAFGHWSTLGLTIRPNLISLDTGCLWGGKLTAVCLEDRSVIQVDCPQYQEPGNF